MKKERQSKSWASNNIDRIDDIFTKSLCIFAFTLCFTTTYRTKEEIKAGERTPKLFSRQPSSLVITSIHPSIQS
jgi:hypothetical protein